ncbi:MAG TPA: caspase family protein [Pseudomonadota bacterium]|nr:caspase family protein [Pseudomonadota bacterium]
MAYPLHLFREFFLVVLPTDADFEAFCMDFYPDVSTRFASGMDRPTKLNLLLKYEPDQDKLISQLREVNPKRVERYWETLVPKENKPPTPVHVDMENAFALCVGINKYKYVNNLSKAVQDAEDVYRLLIDRKSSGYRPKNIKLLTDEESDQASILAALDDLAGRANEQSTVVLFFACHGGRIETGRYKGQYILPVEADFETEDRLAKTSISDVLFTEKLRQIRSQKLLVILDCCHSGGIGQPRSPSSDFSRLQSISTEMLSLGQGRIIMASASVEQYAYEQAADRNGLFTKHLLGGLQGKAGKDGVVRVFELFDYVKQSVVKEQPKQTPLFKAETHDNFAVAICPNGGG